MVTKATEGIGRAKRYAVERVIDARPEAVWTLLTDAGRYPSWNPSVVSLRGRIETGHKIELVSTVNPKRKFVLTVSGVQPPRQMVWSSGIPLGLFRGVRTFTLTPGPSNSTVFAMSETFSGAMLGAIEGSLPDFTASFDAFAAGLKQEVESNTAAATR